MSLLGLLCQLFHVHNPGQVLHDVDTQETEVWHLLYMVPIDVKWLNVNFSFPEIHDESLATVVFRIRLLSCTTLSVAPLFLLADSSPPEMSLTS